MDRLGSYRLRKRLAVGGMGEVYLGEKVGPEGFVKPVVLKCVLPQLASDRAFVKLFEDEARLSARLNHPNIAQVYDFGLVDNTYYIAMEYVPGYTVDDIRRKLGSIGQYLPLQHVACIASQVCQGLHYAHTLTDGEGVPLGLVHRDVSPHNLIVSVNGDVKIVDFGIAKARAGLTRVQAKGAVGKFGYMSPEQARGEQVDGRSDVFSLGICLWELLTNQRLHDPNLDRAPEYSPARPIRSVDQLRTDMPRQFMQIMDTALSIQPEDRYQTAQAMHLALERFQAAMTHYAGQAALAQYIKDLVDGRVENPEQPLTGELVQPAGDPLLRPATQRPGRSSMDEAQRYEEVFGVTMASKRPRHTLRAVPKSWDTKPPPPTAVGPGPARGAGRGTPESPVLLGSPDAAGGSSGPRSSSLTGPRTTPDLRPGPWSTGDLALRESGDLPRRGGGDPTRPTSRPGQGRMLDLSSNLSESDSIELDLSASPRPVTRTPPRPRPEVRPAPGGTGKLVVTVVALAALAGALYALSDRIEPLARRLLGESVAGPATPAVNSTYRIVSTPPGATVYLDGERQPGVTPLIVDLLPSVEYRVEVKREGRATSEKVITAQIHEGRADLRFALEKAATLVVKSVPPGASVTVDGREIETQVTPMTLADVPAGRKIVVQAKIPGLPVKARKVAVPPGGSKTLVIEF